MFPPASCFRHIHPLQVSRFSLWLATNRRIEAANNGMDNARYSHNFLSDLSPVERSTLFRVEGAVPPTFVLPSSTATDTSSGSGGDSSSSDAPGANGGAPAPAQPSGRRRRLLTKLPGRYTAIPTSNVVAGQPIPVQQIVDITPDMLVGLPRELDYAPLMPPPIAQLCGDCNMCAVLASVEGAIAFATKRQSPPLSEVRSAGSPQTRG